MATTSKFFRYLKSHFGIGSDLRKDTTAPLSITVKDEDNKFGIPKVPAYCALAWAARRTKGVVEAHFFNRIAWIVYSNGTGLHARRYSIRKDVQKVIKGFDRRKPIPPGKYTLHPLVKSERKAAKRKRPGVSGKGKKPESRVKAFVRHHESVFLS